MLLAQGVELARAAALGPAAPARTVAHLGARPTFRSQAELERLDG